MCIVKEKKVTDLDSLTLENKVEKVGEGHAELMNTIVIKGGIDGVVINEIDHKVETCIKLSTGSDLIY